MDMEAVERYLHIVQSSSPSYVLMASIENGIFQMEQLRRKDGMRKFADSLLEMRESLSAMKNLRLVGRELKGRYGIFDLDPSKVVISTRYASFDGEETVPSGNGNVRGRLCDSYNGCWRQ